MESIANTNFPKRPAKASKIDGREMNLYSNFFSMKFTKAQAAINKYTCKFTPEIPDNSRKLRGELVKQVREGLNTHLGFHIEGGLCIYSLMKVQTIAPLKVTHDGAEYTLDVEWVQELVKTDKEYLNFLKNFFNSMMRSLRFENIGRKSFNSAKAHSLTDHKIKVWPGFESSLIMKETGVLLNIDVAFKVVREDSALEYMDEQRKAIEQKGGDWQEQIQEAMKGATVVTRYNQKAYKVDRIDFTQSPATTFDKQGTPTSYADYYKTRYNEAISDPNQPLLINKDRKTGVEIALIPELCQVTGLTDKMRADFRLMKDLATIVHTNADAKVKECKNLFEMFKGNTKCQEKAKLWQLDFEENPTALKGYQFKAGNMLMGAKGQGQRITFDIEACARDIDRKIQDKMYEQPALAKWAIFHGDKDAQVAKQFSTTLDDVLKQFGYENSPPQVFQVKGGMNAGKWQEEIRAKLSSDVQAIVCLLPGQKGRCNLYDPVKSMMLKDFAVPSQVVLTSTISRGKNVRSIVNKILIQINAKIGGVPWAVDKLPLCSVPTMVCGMDVFHSTALGKKSVLALTASVNETATKFWSTCVVQNESGEEASQSLKIGMTKALEAFKRVNGTYPAQIIFYRDGVGEGQVAAVCMPEIDQVKSAVTAAGAPTKLMYLNVCKRVNTRLFGGQPGRYANVNPGTVVDCDITDKDVYEFYLVSTSTRQGMVSPCRYTVLFDSIGASPDQIEHLTYKLCYTYYNVSGAIKEPACIRYAHRLAALVGERGGRGKEPPQPHVDYENREPTLYYI